MRDQIRRMVGLLVHSVMNNSEVSNIKQILNENNYAKLVRVPIAPPQPLVL